MLKNCFNYVGSKDRLFSLIDENLDKDKEIFIDLFCGSGVVGINELYNYKRVVLNDACWQVTETLKYFRDNSFESITKELNNCIKKYKLSKENKEGYNALREDYNEVYYDRLTFSPVMFYCLLTHSFNYNIHISKEGRFNVPFGKDRSYFSNSLKTKLEGIQWELHENSGRITVKSEDFSKLVEKSEKFISKSMFYVDPPYLISDSSYGRIYYLGRWNEDKERTLLNNLSFIDSKGGSFLLSNVLENNGNYNKILDTWAKKYNVIEVPVDYTNCNYQRKNAGKTKEVLIRNY